MIAGLKPYTEYTDSGLPWLGQVPAHWRTVRNGSLFGQRSQTGFAELPILEVSLKTGVQVRAFGGAKRKQIMADLAKYKRAAKGDLAYNTMRMWQGALGVCPVDGLVSPAYVVARPYAGVEPQYFAALFRTGDYMAEIDAASRGIVKDRNRLYWDQFKQMQSPCPPPNEQAAIVRFLDWANGRLGRAIQAKRKVIALLMEQKQAIVQRGVSYGLDEGVTLKSSDAPWLGDIPSHWQVSRLKHCVTSIEQGWSPQCDAQPAGEHEWGVLKVGCVNKEIFGWRQNKKLPDSLRPDASLEVRDGDILVSRANTRDLLGLAALADKPRPKLILSDKLFRFRAKGERFDSAFLVLALRAKASTVGHAEHSGDKLKAEIMVDHFHEQVLAAGKIGGQARAMVVTSGIERAVQYFHAMKAYLQERKSPYQAIVAFSGEHEFGGTKVSEASLNGFPSKDIADKIRDDPYRFLICADKFQTGYDEPLLHTMYVDKALSGVKAVQTLSRLNRAHPQKHDCFVLDFQNNSETITLAFQDYYRATLLAEETDPNKLHDLKAALDGAQVYSPDQVQQFAALFLAGAERDQLDPILDACVAAYTGALDEDQQVDFKGKAKVFCRTYDFLASVMLSANAEWEKLSILLNLLVSKLPAPKEEDLAKGILEAIDMDSYRVEKKALMKIALADTDAEIAPVPTEGGGRKPEPELDRLSNILKIFNDNFGTLFADTDRVAKRIRDDIAPKVAADKAFQNARDNTPHTARMAHDQALGKVMQILLKDDTQVYKQFVENESFRRFVGDMVFELTRGA